MSDSVNKTTCPKCGRELEYLENVQSAIITWKFSRDGEYSDRPDVVRVYDDVNWWQCPYCGTQLAYNEEDALEVLKGHTGTERAYREREI